MQNKYQKEILNKFNFSISGIFIGINMMAVPVAADRDMDILELSAYGNVRHGQDSGGCNIQCSIYRAAYFHFCTMVTFDVKFYPCHTNNFISVVLEMIKKTRIVYSQLVEEFKSNIKKKM